MNEQEVFDTVVRHLAKQGAKSAVMKKGETGTSYERCMYRGPDGLKCAAGALINDDEYDPSMEGVVFGSMSKRPARLAPFEHLINRLQVAHDAALNGSDLRQLLRNAAAIYELSTEVLDDATFPTHWGPVGGPQ